MKNFLFKISILFYFLISINNNAIAAQSIATNLVAKAYKITVHKVQLCETGSSAAVCLNPVTLGTGAQTMDIAGVEVGATAGSYGNPATITLGTTYTYVQTVIERAITIRADVEVAGSRHCKTGGTAGTGTNFAIGTASTSATTNGTEMVVYIPDDQGTHTLTGVTLNGGNAGFEIDNADNITGLTEIDGAGTAGTVATGDTYIQHRVALTTPFTMGLNTPNVDISFGTTTALGSYYTTDKNGSTSGTTTSCLFWAMEPTVSVTITD